MRNAGARLRRAGSAITCAGPVWLSSSCGDRSMLRPAKTVKKRKWETRQHNEDLRAAGLHVLIPDGPPTSSSVSAASRPAPVPPPRTPPESKSRSRTTRPKQLTSLTTSVRRLQGGVLHSPHRGLLSPSRRQSLLISPSRCSIVVSPLRLRYPAAPGPGSVAPPTPPARLVIGRGARTKTAKRAYSPS